MTSSGSELRCRFCDEPIPRKSATEKGTQRLYCKDKPCRQRALYAMRKAPGLSAHAAGGVYR